MDTSSLHSSQTDNVGPASRVHDLLRPEVLQALDISNGQNEQTC